MLLLSVTAIVFQKWSWEIFVQGARLLSVLLTRVLILMAEQLDDVKSGKAHARSRARVLQLRLLLIHGRTI